MNQRRIVVVGSTGFTGRLVAAELAAGGIPFVLTGRDRARVEALAAEVGGGETALVDVRRIESLDAVLRSGDVVVNCAGPFSELGVPVVEACVGAGAHYLDTTGEQRFMKRIHDLYDDRARRAGVTVANAMAFEYALGDLAAGEAAHGLARPLRSVDVVYAWQGGTSAASRGTRLSVVGVLREGGVAYRSGEWVERRAGDERRTVRIGDDRPRSAVWFPAGEILMLPRRLEVDRVDGWIVVGRRLATMLPWVANALPAAAAAVAPVFRWAVGFASEGPTSEERSASRFVIRAEAVGADGRIGVADLAGRDPYGITARLAAMAAIRLAGEHDVPGGVLTPAQVLHTGALEQLLGEWDLSLQRSGSAPD
jgi:short subunit dehydrogenase-like uncharacterized protein